MAESPGGASFSDALHHYASGENILPNMDH